MYRGITLLETLIALFILSLTLAFALPKWQKNDPQYFLEKEQQRLYFFLRNIQARAEISSAIWFILANQDRANQRWCITAQVKSDHFCDCFQPQNCPKNLYAHFYYPYFEGKTMLLGPKLYPSEVAVKFNGARNTMETNCFMLQAEEHRTLFSFFNVGSIKLKSDQAASACTR